MSSAPTPQQLVVQQAREEAAKRREQITGRARVIGELGGEEHIYRPNLWDEKERAYVSFFRDLYLTQFERPGATPQMRDRPQRHQEHSERYYRQRERFQPLPGSPLQEQRATTTTSLGGLIPPAYLLDLVALAPRNGRVFADQIDHKQLPDTGMSIIVPRMTTASAVGMQTEGNTAATQDMAETDLTVNVGTVAGYLPVSRQAIERGSYGDTLLMNDLVARYQMTLDLGALNGLGTGVTLLGALNTANIISVAEATASASRLYISSINCLQQANTQLGALGYAVTKVFMHPRRWQWLTAQVDTQGRPVIGGLTGADYNTFGHQDNSGGNAAGYVGSWCGVACYLDANIPVTLGGGTEDRIIFCATDCCHLWERAGDPVGVAFQARQASSLSIDLVQYGYCAVTFGRFPQAVAVVTGAGLAAPAF